jgi:GT2 family glycosyltransferase
VTIVIVAYAPAEVCGACLAAVRRNTPWPRLRIVVVDNGTGPATRAVLDAAASADPRVVVLANATNRGFARAANQGLSHTSSDFVVFLNDDTAVGPGWLPRLVAHLESEARIGLVCPTTNEIGNAAKLPTSYASFTEMEAFATERAAAHAGQRRPIESIALFCAAARREALAGVGFLDERFEIGMFEDDDLSRSLRRRGYELCVALDSFVHHVGQASFSRLPDDRYLALWEANRRRYEEKWGERWTAPEK